jgi:small-conductance mechanosensitive channel
LRAKYMKGIQKSILTVLLLIVVAALSAILWTRDWSDSARRLHADQMRSAHNTQQPVDTSALQTAQQLAPLAVSHWEQQYAQDALRLADSSVDLAFNAALDDARENPAALTPDMLPLAAHVKDADARLNVDQDSIARLMDKLAKAKPSAKDDVQGELDLVKAQMVLDQDELDDAHEDLTRAGGDKLALVQSQLDQHEAGEQHAGKDGGALVASAAQSTSPESTKSTYLLAQVVAIYSLRTKESLLLQARENGLLRANRLLDEHNALEKRFNKEKAQKRILKAGVKADAAAKSNSPAPDSTTPAATPSSAVSPTDATGAAISQLVFLKQLSADQKSLAMYGKRIGAEQSLAATYGNWLDLVTARQHAFLHGLFVSILWIVLIAIFVFLTNIWVQRFFADLSIDRREMHTMRAVVMFALQTVGAVLILLVIFGVPNNFATIAALAGAGITVAMKDFIIGFFGWFILMGKNGIRPGDWVEINGVGGEVLTVGLLHTVILETGSWADAGHPTGRKVTFVNSFAIEGHYFNFSTSGQWMWDEIRVQVPADKDPYAIADQIQKLAADETKSNAGAAESEWERVTPSYAKNSFSAVPSLSVQPAGSGVDVRVRYITRANERHEVRGRLYRGVVGFLHDATIPEATVSKPSA